MSRAVVQDGHIMLNFNTEDVFAGMDATLRGHTIVHREYFQVGKGRYHYTPSPLTFKDLDPRWPR